MRAPESDAILTVYRRRDCNLNGTFTWLNKRKEEEREFHSTSSHSCYNYIKIQLSPLKRLCHSGLEWSDAPHVPNISKVYSYKYLRLPVFNYLPLCVFQILDEVEKRRAISPALVQPFMRGIMEAPFPAPGRTITVKNFLPGSGTEVRAWWCHCEKTALEPVVLHPILGGKIHTLID